MRQGCRGLQGEVEGPAINLHTYQDMLGHTKCPAAAGGCCHIVLPTDLLHPGRPTPTVMDINMRLDLAVDSSAEERSGRVSDTELLPVGRQGVAPAHVMGEQ